MEKTVWQDIGVVRPSKRTDNLCGDLPIFALQSLLNRIDKDGGATITVVLLNNGDGTYKVSVPFKYNDDTIKLERDEAFEW